FTAVARYGLTEIEIRDLLGSGGAPLPQACWAPLRLAAAGLLEETSGFFHPANDDVLAVVRCRYLAAAEPSSRRALAEHCGARPPGGRAVHGRLWQLRALGDAAKLAAALSDGDTLVHAFRADPDAVCRYWTELRGISEPGDAYRALIEAPESAREAAWT